MGKLKTSSFVIAAVFIIALAVVTCYRSGKDLKVGLFGAEQVLQKKSPYDNPTDPKRPIFRYAPAYAILLRPFLLKSEMYAPFEFNNITASVLAWYIAEILALVISALLILKTIPAPSKETALRNLFIGFLIAMPLVAYELANCQNKIIALAFILASVYLFEKNRFFLSALYFNMAIVIYVPLVFFMIYFALRGRIKYILPFIAAFLLVFIIAPSLMIGYEFNNFLLKDWFERCLKPFFLTASCTTYIDLRPSSQSLPSAIGRIFVSGATGNFKCVISPLAIHVMIRIFSAAMVIVSGIIAWRRQSPNAIGLIVSAFLMLALILPSYCIWYTWAWLFVPYLAVFNYISYPDVPAPRKKALIIATVILILGSYSIVFKLFNIASVLCWATIIFWAALAGTLLKTSYSRTR